MKPFRVLVALLLAAGAGSSGAQQASTFDESAQVWRPAYAMERQALRVALGGKTHLVWLPAERRPALDEANATPSSRAGLGVEFKLKARSGQKPSNLLRLQLDSKSALQFRPRGGGLSVTYREQF